MSDGSPWPDSVLAVMGHPDDAELWAGGALALHAEHGARVTIVVASHSPVRDAEAAAGAAVLGAEIHSVPELQSEVLAAILRNFRPEVLITHSLADTHPDHHRTSRTVLEALPEPVIETGRPRRVYGCETYNGLTLDGPTRPGTIIDVSSTFAKKRRALSVHNSQPIEYHFGPMAETLARLWGARIGVAYAEQFTPIPVLGRLPSISHL
ncbi:Uncharacterized proteins%2C LmbE homologs [Mycobacterium tuberculosis]|nr:Uncharacterized proteins%2C LmbE homologs [Mycobacterium tuberculosis]